MELSRIYFLAQTASYCTMVAGRVTLNYTVLIHANTQVYSNTTRSSLFRHEKNLPPVNPFLPPAEIFLKRSASLSSNLHRLSWLVFAHPIVPFNDCLERIDRRAES